jgi:hypothetical protein
MKLYWRACSWEPTISKRENSQRRMDSGRALWHEVNIGISHFTKQEQKIET